jgi:3-oxoadipate enol-lactonase
VTFGVIRQRPERASALILADTRCGADTDEGRAGRARMLTILADKGPLGVFDEMRPKLFGKTTNAERPGVVEEGKWMVEDQSPAAVGGAIRAIRDRPDSTPLLGSIRVPTLIVVGEEDELTPPVESVRMHDAIAGSTLVRIPRAGHLASLEDPAAFNAALGTFLACVASL